MLIDFNMAMDDEQHDECVGGTKPYMSPEQVRLISAPPEEDSAQLDGKSDVYSLALILCRLLTGQHPFGDVSVNATEQQLLLCRQDWTPKQLASCPHVDSKTIQLLTRCLSFDPQFRPAAAELSALLEDTLRRRQASPSRRKLLAGALAAGLGLIGAGIAIGRSGLDHRGFYDEGLAHLANGRHKEAINSFSRSLDIEPEFAPALVARAYTKETRGNPGDFASAIEDYTQAYQWTRDPGLQARMGYCAARRNSFEEAIMRFGEAIERGFTKAEVLNNLGYCQMRLAYYDDAEDSLTKAIEIDPKLQAPWCNRAMNNLYRSELRGVPISEIAVNDIEMARRTGENGPTLLFYAAAILDRLPGESPNREETILEFLDEALELGLNVNLLKERSDRFQELRTTPEFITMIERPRSTRPVPDGPRLLQIGSKASFLASND